jgi:uncharacterized protein with HEPN domain
MKNDPRIYLLHIRDALGCIERYTTEGKKRFLADEKTQDAVIYNLAIIGEAVKKLPRPLRDAHPAIPWKAIAGMRDIVVHEYDSTEIPKVWNVVKRDLPRLKRTIDVMLRRDAPEARR